jgi:hypothetical protein
VDLFKVLMNAEEDPSIHTARMLIILNEFSRGKNEKIAGLTKLVKLDFLLRYPMYFVRALEQKGVSPETVRIKEFEKYSVESSMIRYHYGPWDYRYRAFINILVGKGLAEVEVQGNTILIGITSKGVELTKNLIQQQEFQDYSYRVTLLRTHFDIGAMSLKEFIYETFP